MNSSITKILMIAILLGLWSSVATGKPLSPIEKALKALAEKQLLVDHLAGTATAQMHMMSNSTTASTITAASNSISGTSTTLIATPPTVSSTRHDPLNLTTLATAETIKVNWSNTATAWADFGGYQFNRVDLTGDHAQAVTTLVTPLSSYVDVSVTAKTYYEYQVNVVDKKGNTLLASNRIISYLLPSQPPLVPDDLQANSLSERVHLKWKKAKRTSHDIKGYLVYRSLENQKEANCLNAQEPASKEEYYDESGQVNAWYSYYIVAIDNRGLTSTASNTVTAKARARNRNNLILMSTAYRGNGRVDTGLNADIQFSYYIGTLYGEQDPILSSNALYLDPISLWLLATDFKYTAFTEQTFPVAIAGGLKGGLQLFAGQQSTSSGQFEFSEKSELDYLWGGYASFSRTVGPVGLHAGYLYGNYGNPIFFLSKYMNTEDSKQTFYFGLDFPIVRRMNAAIEILFPRKANFLSDQQPFLVNLHVDRLFNFDIAYLQWDQGWGFLGYFNIGFTVFPGN